MLYINNPQIYNFDTACDAALAKINDNCTSFVLNTEFGNVFFEITRRHWEPIYRYMVTRWRHAPVNRYTANYIRDINITHHISMAKVGDPTIQRLMIVMAMTHVLIEYIGGDYTATRDTVDAMALIYMQSRGHCSSDGRDLISHYLDSISGGIFRRQPDSDHVNFINNFFSKRMEMTKRLSRKICSNFRERSGNQVDFDIGDNYFNHIFFLLFQENRMRMKRDGDTYELYKKLMEDNTHIYTAPEFLKALVQGGHPEE